jgi:hypothetical protein
LGEGERAGTEGEDELGGEEGVCLAKSYAALAGCETRELEGLDLDFRVPRGFLGKGWDTTLVKVLVTLVHSRSVRGQWNLFTMICCKAEREGPFVGFAAAKLREKWRELAENGFQPVVQLTTAYKRRMKARASDLTLVESGIHMCRALPDAVTMKLAIRVLGHLVDSDRTEASSKMRAQKKGTCPEWAEP